jgi:hypothetical protein
VVIDGQGTDENGTLEKRGSRLEPTKLLISCSEYHARQLVILLWGEFFVCP